MSTIASSRQPSRASLWQRTSFWVRDHLVAAYGIAALLYLFAPIAVVAIFSFNKPIGRQNSTWNTFSLDAWTHINRDPTIMNALGISLRIALVSTIAATVLGTLISLDRKSTRLNSSHT